MPVRFDPRIWDAVDYTPSLIFRSIVKNDKLKICECLVKYRIYRVIDKIFPIKDGQNNGDFWMVRQRYYSSFASGGYMVPVI